MADRAHQRQDRRAQRGRAGQRVGQARDRPSDYTLSQGYDITLLELTAASIKTPTKVAGASERGLWAPGAVETIVGWGVTSEGGDLLIVLQEARCP